MRIARRPWLALAVVVVSACASIPTPASGPPAAPTPPPPSRPPDSEAERSVIAQASTAAVAPVLAGATRRPRPQPSLDPTLDWAAGPISVVLRVRSYLDLGVPWAQAWDRTPTFSLYVDGRVIFRRRGDGRLMDGHLSRLGMRQLLAITEQSGLLDAPLAKYLRTGASDAPTTLFTALTTEGHSAAWVFDLGFDGDHPFMTDEARVRRRALALFGARLEGLHDVIDPFELDLHGPFEPPAVRLFISPWKQASDSEPEATRPWPLEDLATYGRTDPRDEGIRCVIVSGGDLEQLWPLSSGIYDPTAWTSGQKPYHIAVEWLLPDELHLPCRTREILSTP